MPRPPCIRRALLIAALLLEIGRTAHAQESAPSAGDAATSDSAASPHVGDVWTRDVLTGDWGGERTALENDGVILGADSFDEVLGNLSGGVRQGAIYEGRLELLATLDLDKLLSWPNATLHANAYQIRGRGRGLSANDLGNNLLVASNIEATHSTRLFDLWLEQLLWNGTVSVRAGQIAADDEFFISQYASSFINATFGWPAIMASDLPSGGPAYPLATPGIRIKYAASNALSFQAALFNGDPAGAGIGDPQQRDASGTSFRIGDNSFVIAEANYAINQDSNATGLAASYKLGAWFHSGSFADQRFDNTGQSLAAPTSTGTPAQHDGDYGLYGVVDQMLWREPDTPERGVSMFIRLSAAPQDRNPISVYGDLGLTLTDPLPGRAADLVGIAVGFAGISQRARALDADERRFSGIPNPVRNSEAVMEATYRYQLSPWLALQPDLQLIRHPGAGAVSPASLSATQRVPNAFVLGLRSSIIF